jgi:hypothetical protein
MPGLKRCSFISVVERCAHSEQKAAQGLNTVDENNLSGPAIWKPA